MEDSMQFNGEIAVAGMYRLIIRNMLEDDIPAVLEIERIAFSTPCTEQFFLTVIYKKNAFSKVAVFEGKIIGHICVDYLLHESHILDLAVHPDFRRRGIATILMNEAIGELKTKGCAFMYLKVRVSNTVAQQFYNLVGFKRESIRKKYYDNPDEDAILMIGRL
jgi:ribosomal-protein-alanine N-acetyltransferase